ncbi:MAG: arsenate reductase ArsC [Candidatus Eremiobacteraeota bacterium]|nr:arsenate reductase ArsC [Candidatus Eremiobacteraeota bacterium]
MKQRVLFVCVLNSARSQIAEAWLNSLCGDSFQAESAGLEPGSLNPHAVQVMSEAGIDIAGHATKSVFELFRSGKTFSYVITVCDEASAERCPVFPGFTQRLHWSFADPAALNGSDEFKLAQTRIIRDAIKTKVAEWCSSICPPAAASSQT